MKKHIIPAIALLIAILTAFLLGFFSGRKLSSAPVQISTVLSEDPATRGLYTNENVSEESGLIININTATVSELSLLPGIGEVLSQRIVDYREENGPFTFTGQLMNVEGISQKRFDAIKDYITTGG